MADESVDATNILEIAEAPAGLLALPAGRGIWLGTDLVASPTSAPTGDVSVVLHRGDVTGPALTIPVSLQPGAPIIPPTEVTLAPEMVVFTFPADTQTFTNQLIATLTLTVTTTGTAGEPEWELVGAPAGYTLSTTGNTRQVLYTGARPTEPASFQVQVDVPRTDTAQPGSASSIVRTTLIAPPQRTDATIADITRTNLDDFTQAITQLYTGTGLEWSIFSSNAAVATVSLDANNLATINPVADGTTTMTVVVSNNGGTDQYEFNVNIDVLAQPVIAWPTENYNTAAARYELTAAPSAIQVQLGTLLPTVSAPTGTVGSATFGVSRALVAVVGWTSAGALSLFPGSAAADRTYSGELVVTVSPTATVRGAVFRRAIQISVSAAAAPVRPPARTPGFSPAGGLTRTVRVGEFFDIDWTGAFTPAAPIVPVSQNTEIISVESRPGDVVRCTGVRVGTTTYTVSGAYVVRVVVVSTAPTPTTSAWYQQQAGGTYAAVSSLAVSVAENSARANVVAANPLYLTMTQLENRPVTYQEIPPLAGVDVQAATSATSITLPGGGTAQAVRVDVFVDGTQFDFETQSSYPLTLQAEADAELIGTVTYDAHTASLPIALTITDVFEPTGPPDFQADDAAVNLPAKTDGSDTAFSLGTFDAGQGATYAIDSSLASDFRVETSGELVYIGDGSECDCRKLLDCHHHRHEQPRNGRNRDLGDCESGRHADIFSGFPDLEAPRRADWRSFREHFREFFGKRCEGAASCSDFDGFRGGRRFCFHRSGFRQRVRGYIYRNGDYSGFPGFGVRPDRCDCRERVVFACYGFYRYHGGVGPGCPSVR